MSSSKEKTHIDQLHYEHKIWIAYSSLYADELIIYQKLLEKIAAENSSAEIRKRIEHFQNQFIIQKEQIDILSHRINKHEQSLAYYAQKHPVAIDHVLFDDHTSLRSDRDIFDRIFRELKADFISFIQRSL